MKKNIVFIFPLLFLILSFFNTPLILPSSILRPHYFIPYLNYLEVEYYYSILQKYDKFTLLNGESKIDLDKKYIITVEILKDRLKNFKNDENINFYKFIRFCVGLAKWNEKIKIILPYHPFDEEYLFTQSLEKETGIPIDIIIEKNSQFNPILAINSKHFFNERKINVNILLSDDIKNFKNINLEKVNSHENIIILKKLTEEILNNANTLEFNYFYSDEKEVDFNLVLNGVNTITFPFTIAVTDEIDKNVLFVSEDNFNGYFETLFKLDKIKLSELDNKNLNQYSLIIFDGIPIKKIDQNISKKIVDGFHQDNFGLFFISEAKEIGKTDDNPLIESILPVELNPKSLKEDPKVAILLLLDVSSSMMGEKLSIAKVSASQMLVNLKSEDLVSIYLFWDQFEKLFNFTQVKDVSSFFSFNKIEATGGTDLAPCLEIGLKDLLRVSSANRHAVIISDFQTKPASWDNILSYAIENDISISVIQIGTDINSTLAEKIAKTTGGNVYSANSFNAIPTILFEDRKRISRPPFIKQNYTIYDNFNDPIDRITGMNITTSKEKSNVILKNQYEDPLFAFIKNGTKGSAVFLSDSNGIYTKNLFNNTYFKLIFNRYFESQLSNLINKVTITENASGFSVILNSPQLYNPQVILFFNQEKIFESFFNKIGQGYFSFSISTLNSGSYNLQVKDLGNTILKLPLFYNAKAIANNYSSVLYSLNNKKMIFKKFYSINLWLVLFFISSIFATYFLRIFKNS